MPRFWAISALMRYAIQNLSLITFSCDTRDVALGYLCISFCGTNHYSIPSCRKNADWFTPAILTRDHRPVPSSENARHEEIKATLLPSADIAHRCSPPICLEPWPNTARIQAIRDDFSISNILTCRLVLLIPASSISEFQAAFDVAEAAEQGTPGIVKRVKRERTCKGKHKRLPSPQLETRPFQPQFVPIH